MKLRKKQINYTSILFPKSQNEQYSEIMTNIGNIANIIYNINIVSSTTEIINNLQRQMFHDFIVANNNTSDKAWSIVEDKMKLSNDDAADVSVRWIKLITVYNKNKINNDKIMEARRQTVYFLR